MAYVFLSACTARVPHPCFLLCHVSLCSRVAHTGSQYAPFGISHLEVHEQTGDERPWTLRPDDHHERGHPSLLSEGRVVQASFLPSSLFLLPVRHDLCFGELIEQRRRIGPVKCMQTASNEGILSSKVLFPRVAYGI